MHCKSLKIIMLSPLLTELMESFALIPGIGKKTALRIAIYLMQNDIKKQKALKIHSSLAACLNNLKKCEMCQMISEIDICAICKDENRIGSICIVENINDFISIESAKIYKGTYFILYGCMSPIEGRSVKELNLGILNDIITKYNVNELVLALPMSHEGLATSHTIAHLFAKSAAKITKLRCGLPFGGGLEYLDQNTLLYAFNERVEIKQND